MRSVFENRQITVEDRRASLPNERGEIARALRDLPIRSQAFTPLLREGKAIGVMIVSRSEVRPFQEHELELMKGFADQAAIAIENARLVGELRQRTTDLGEALEQQTATSEVLRVISASPGELMAVFQAMLENAVRICDAKFGNLLLYDGNTYKMTAMHRAPPEWDEHRRREPTFHAGPKQPLGRLAATKQFQHVADARMETSYAEHDPVFTPLVDIAGARTVLYVPMLKEDTLVGALVIYRQEVRPFTYKQIGLLQNFAAQAVIAIENARLLNELRESLQQQTATAEVLQVISSSPAELKPVFQALLANATRLCEAKFGALNLWEADAFRVVALHNAPPAFAEFVQRGPLRPGPNVPAVRMARTKQVVHVADVRTEQAYIDREPLVVAGADLGGYRTLLAVPMIKETDVIGGIIIFRQEVRPFTDKQIELVQNFAAQAVIAIENTRLLNELRCNSRPRRPTCSR